MNFLSKILIILELKMEDGQSVGKDMKVISSGKDKISILLTQLQFKML